MRSKTSRRFSAIAVALISLIIVACICPSTAPSTELTGPTLESTAPAGIPAPQPVERSPVPEQTDEPLVDTFGCDLGAVFEADVTVPDNSKIEAGQPFTKTWLIRNTGSCAWVPGYRLSSVDGDQMGGPGSVAIPQTLVGESAEASVGLIAPAEEGRHRGSWRVCVNETECFGDVVYVQIFSVATCSVSTPSSPTTVQEWEGVYIGMPSDDVLKIHPKSETTDDPVVLGQDSEGLVVRWSYPGPT